MWQGRSILETNVWIYLQRYSSPLTRTVHPWKHSNHQPLEEYLSFIAFGTFHVSLNKLSTGYVISTLTLALILYMSSDTVQ